MFHHAHGYRVTLQRTNWAFEDVPALLSYIGVIGSQIRSVTINVNNRCPLRCRHCSIGYSSKFRGDGRRIDSSNLRNIIESIDPLTYDMILLAGGEPSLDPSLIREAILAAKARGLLCAIVTAPIWAKNLDVADRFLRAIPGLDILIASYDSYHLEFLSIDHYKIATSAATKLGIPVCLHVTFTHLEEKSDLIGKVQSIRNSVFISSFQTVPVGNAAEPFNVKYEYFTAENPEDLEKLPRGCLLGNVLVDEKHEVHGCCWSRTVAHSPFSVTNKHRDVKLALETLENNQLFQAVRARGFIGALTRRGQEAVLHRFQGRRFVNECDLCLAWMKERDSWIWKGFRSSSVPNSFPKETR